IGVGPIKCQAEGGTKVHFDLQCFVRVGSVVAPVIETVSFAAYDVRGEAVGIRVGGTEGGIVGRPLGEGQTCRAPGASAANDCSLVGVVRRTVAFEDMAAVVSHVSHVHAGF